MKKTVRNLFAAMAALVMVTACSEDGPKVDERYGEIVREVNFGSTMAIDIPGYTSDNAFVGITENDRNPGGSFFVAEHVGTCLLKSAARPGTDYRIKVKPTVDIFPGLVTDWNTTAEAVIEANGKENCTLENGVLTVKVSGAAGVYFYEYALAGGTTIKQSRVRYCILENAPLSELTKYINQRYISDASGVYFNASTIQNATILATVSDMEPYVLEIDNENVTVDSYVVTVMSPEMRN